MTNLSPTRLKHLCDNGIAASDVDNSPRGVVKKPDIRNVCDKMRNHESRDMVDELNDPSNESTVLCNESKIASNGSNCSGNECNQSKVSCDGRCNDARSRVQCDASDVNVSQSLRGGIVTVGHRYEDATSETYWLLTPNTTLVPASCSCDDAVLVTRCTCAGITGNYPSECSKLNTHTISRCSFVDRTLKPTSYESLFKLFSAAVVVILSIFVYLSYVCVLPNMTFCMTNNTAENAQDSLLYPYNTSYTTHPPGTSRRLPQCLIIGVRKCGTRALLRFLSLHPSIAISGKEVHFFDNDDNYSRGHDWYRDNMPYSYPHQITMEKTPAYFIGERVPERVYDMNKSLKLLVVVRDPIHRTVSDYTQVMFNKLARGKSGKHFERLVTNRNTGEINPRYMPIQRSVYHGHMRRWLDHFPLSQIHVVNGERLITDPLTEVRAVESFLGLQPKITGEMFYFNETRGFYCVVGTDREPCLADSKGRTHPQIHRRVIDKLKDYFAPHNELFFAQVGRRFPWS